MQGQSIVHRDIHINPTVPFLELKDGHLSRDDLHGLEKAEWFQDTLQVVQDGTLVHVYILLHDYHNVNVGVLGPEAVLTAAEALHLDVTVLLHEGGLEYSIGNLTDYPVSIPQSSIIWLHIIIDLHHLTLHLVDYGWPQLQLTVVVLVSVLIVLLGFLLDLGTVVAKILGITLVIWRGLTPVLWLLAIRLWLLIRIGVYILPAVRLGLGLGSGWVLY